MRRITGPKVPNTISDEKMRRIQRLAQIQEARDGGMFTKKATARRVAASANRRKFHQN